LELVELSDHIDYFYIKKLDNTQILELPFDSKFITLDEKARNNLKLLLKKLEQKHLNKVSYQEDFYLTNILIGKYMVYYDYIWNGPF